jgi:hypothetical protein
VISIGKPLNQKLKEQPITAQAKRRRCKQEQGLCCGSTQNAFEEEKNAKKRKPPWVEGGIP